MSKKNNNLISLDAEEFDNLLWPAVRYCASRRSYANGYIKDYWRIIRRNRDKLNEQRLAFLARDVRSCISESMRWSSNMHIYNAFNDRIVKDAFTLLIDHLITNPTCNPLKTEFWIDCVACTIHAKEWKPTDLTGLPFDPEGEYTFIKDYVAFANCLDRMFECKCNGQGKTTTVDAVEAPYLRKWNSSGEWLPRTEWGFRYVPADNLDCYIPQEYIISVTPKTTSK